MAVGVYVHAHISYNYVIKIITVYVKTIQRACTIFFILRIYINLHHFHFDQI